MTKPDVTQALAALEFHFLKQTTNYSPPKKDRAYQVSLAKVTKKNDRSTQPTDPLATIPKLAPESSDNLPASSVHYEHLYWQGWTDRHVQQTAEGQLHNWIPRTKNRWSGHR